MKRKLKATTTVAAAHAAAAATAAVEASHAKRVATLMAKRLQHQREERMVLETALRSGHEHNEVLQGSLRAKQQELNALQQQLKVRGRAGPEGRAGDSVRQARRIEVLTEDIGRLQAQVLKGTQKADELKASLCSAKEALSSAKKHLRVQTDKVEGLAHSCARLTSKASDLRRKVDFYSSAEAHDTDNSPWRQDEVLRQDCKQALSMLQSAQEASEHQARLAAAVQQELFAAAQQQSALAAEHAQKARDLEKQMEERTKELMNVAVRDRQDGRRVQDWVRMMYMKLIAMGLSSRQCASAIEVVMQEQPNMQRKISASDLPNRRFADQCRQELGALCRIDATVKIAQHVHQGAVLGTDEGTHNQQSSTALVAHYDDASICLGIEQMASHFSQEAADRVQGRMQSYGTLSKQVEEIGAKIDLSDAERNLVFSPGAFSATITDQCNSQKKMNSLIDEMKAKMIAQWHEVATEEDKAKRVSELDGDMQHVYCYVHAGVNLAAKFDETMRRYGASSGSLRANVEDEAQEDADVQPDQAPDEFEIEAIVASRLRRGADGEQEKEYRIRWKGWDASYDTWEAKKNMLHAEDMIAEHDNTGQAVLAGRKTRVNRRSVSKLQQIVYEVGKFICVQSGKGVKEDQKGVAFMKWCLMKGYREELQTHLSMKPVVGTRYIVFHYNPRVIYNLRGLYLQFIEDVRITKAKVGLNRLEASVKKLLEDDECLAQMRAASVLCEQIEEPIMWLAKKKTALEMRKVSTDVLGALVRWGTAEGAKELWQRPGTLIQQAYADQKHNALMTAVVAPHATDKAVLELLQACCHSGVEHWKKHAGFGMTCAHDDEAPLDTPVTAQDILCAGAAPANNDSCERVIAKVRYWKTKAVRLRASGVEAQVMAAQNKPFQALQAGCLGEAADVMQLVRKVAKEQKQTQGTYMDECERLIQEKQFYQDLCGAKPSQGAAAVTRRNNLAAAQLAAGDVEANLMFSEEQLRTMKVAELQALKRGWMAVGNVSFSNGAQWKAVFAKEGSGPPNAQGKCGLVKKDYIADLLAAMHSYSELMQGWESHHEGGAPVADSVVDDDADPAADPAAALAADLDADPGPAPATDLGRVILLNTPKKAKTDTVRAPGEEKRREGGARQAHGGGGERRPEHAERHHGACAIVLPAC